MAVYKNVASQKIAVYAWDTDADEPKTGDAAQITAQISKDGAATAATDDTNPTELDATDAPGIYIFDMLQAETNADMIILCAVSSTADISIEPVIIYTTPGSNAAISADAVAISGDSTAADNLESACDNYSATRGLAGTALPAVAADGAGGLPISDAGGLDLDAKLANTNEVTAARMGALTDWINGGRLDLLLDAVKTVTDAIPDAGALTTLLANVAAILADTGTDGVKLDYTQTTDGLTLTVILEIVIAFMAGDVTVADSGSDKILTYMKQNGTTGRIIATVDTAGNRTIALA